MFRTSHNYRAARIRININCSTHHVKYAVGYKQESNGFQWQADGRKNHCDGYEARRPNPWLALAGSLGFVGWLGAVAGFAWFGLRADGSFVWQRAWGWAGTALVLFCLWLTLVRFA